MEVRQGYKLTEVGVIPEEWEATVFKDVSSMKSGQGITSANIDQFSPYPCYGGNGLRGYTNRFTHDGCFALIGRQGALCGNVIGVAGKFYASEHAVVVAPRYRNDIKFLTYVLSGMDLNQYAESSAQPGLSVSKILQLPLALPPTSEQCTIAETLSDFDALINSLDQLIVKKRDIKQAAMQQLLTGKKRLPDFENKWDINRLGDIVLLYQPVTISANQFTESGYPVYGANGVVGYYCEFNHENWQIIVTCRGSTCGTVNRTVGKCWITGNAMVVSCEQNIKINKDFLYYALSNEDLSVCITGTGQPQIVRGPLSDFELLLPVDIAEQAAIVCVLSDMDSEIAALETRLNKTKLIKQAMMQELLTGRIRLV